ncbi:Uncharacterised protein [uncultured archaeon]|nr:Uncharacterised protein [uncultured archaeon]
MADGFPNWALAFGLVALLASLSSALVVPPVPNPTCAGGWNIHGEFVDAAHGGCCHGTDCCQYPAFSDNPLCGSTPAPSENCKGIDCCQYAKYKNTPLCAISSPSNRTPAPDNTTSPPAQNGTGPAPNQTHPACSGLDCCQYDEYKGTALCVVQPTPSEEECDAVPPECPIGRGKGDLLPMLLDPALISGSKCRGACGPDCPDSCVRVKEQTQCITDRKGCAYVCRYSNAVSCGIHTGCQKHDDCYDACAAKGETRMCLPFFGLCHCACDWGCVSEFGPAQCYQWMNGGGPADYAQLYSSPPLRSGPFKSCPGISSGQ